MKKLINNFWFWLSLILIILLGIAGSNNLRNATKIDKQKAEYDKLNSKYKKLQKSQEKLIEMYLATDNYSDDETSDSSSSEDTSDDKVIKTHSQKVKFGEPLIYKEKTGTAQITVNSAKKVNSDNEAVEVLNKNFAEYIALTYTVKCTKGAIDTYTYANYFFSVTGADGLVAEGSLLNIGAIIPKKLQAGQSFEFVYGYGLKTASKTLIVNFNNVQWSGDISQ